MNYYSFQSIYQDIAREYPQPKSQCLNICDMCETGEEHRCNLRDNAICRYKPTDYITHEEAELINKRIKWLAYELKQNKVVKPEVKVVQSIKSISM